MFKTKEEAIEFAKDLIYEGKAWPGIINIWPTENPLIGHIGSEKCICKPRMEKDDDILIFYHNFIIN